MAGQVFLTQLLELGAVMEEYKGLGYPVAVTERTTSISANLSWELKASDCCQDVRPSYRFPCRHRCGSSLAH
jgi:hypothetical protein